MIFFPRFPQWARTYCFVVEFADTAFFLSLVVVMNVIGQTSFILSAMKQTFTL
jgi:hypothetical protein